MIKRDPHIYKVYTMSLDKILRIMIAVILVLKSRVEADLHNNWEIFQGQPLSIDVGGSEFFIEEFVGNEAKVDYKNQPTEELDKSLNLIHDGLAINKLKAKV